MVLAFVKKKKKKIRESNGETQVQMVDWRTTEPGRDIALFSGKEFMVRSAGLEQSGPMNF